jgi:hypothetical protein
MLDHQVPLGDTYMTADPAAPIYPSLASPLDHRSQADLALIGSAFLAGLKTGLEQAGGYAGDDRSEPPTPTCIHKIPLLPVSIDGKRAAAEAVKDFDGKPLVFLLDEGARDGDLLRVFSQTTKALRYLEDSPAKTAKKPGAKAPPVTLSTSSSSQEIANAISGSVLLWENINFSGWLWRFGAGTTSNPGGRRDGNGNISDFRTAVFLQNINDKVSSVSNQSEVWANLRPQRSFAVLHQHINFAGAQLWVPERQGFSDLRQFGWNDVASSMSYTLLPN